MVAVLVNTIQQFTDSVRNHINTHRYQDVLLEDSRIWNQICSSLDVVEDSLYAIESYHKADFPTDTGLKYIYTYGVLQALFLLQDALRNLSEALHIPYQTTQTLLDIRNLRNAAIGHPTKQDHKGMRYYNYISRVSMGKNGFDLLRNSEPRKHDFVHVDISKATTDQLQGIIDAYHKIVEKLEEIDRMHKDKFQDCLLADIFHSAMGYFFEKIAQGIHSHSYGDREFGHTHVRLVKETYEKFEVALRERNELNDYTQFDLREYFHALNRLEGYFSVSDSHMEETDARIYLAYLRHEHEHFVGIAKEIDSDYKITT